MTNSLSAFIIKEISRPGYPLNGFPFYPDNADARPEKDIPQKDRYIMRGDRKGVVLDRQAMKTASEFLGHNRESVIAGHYLY